MPLSAILRSAWDWAQASGTDKLFRHFNKAYGENSSFLPQKLQAMVRLQRMYEGELNIVEGFASGEYDFTGTGVYTNLEKHMKRGTDKEELDKYLRNPKAAAPPKPPTKKKTKELALEARNLTVKAVLLAHMAGDVETIIRMGKMKQEELTKDVLHDILVELEKDED